MMAFVFGAALTVPTKGPRRGGIHAGISASGSAVDGAAAAGGSSIIGGNSTDLVGELQNEEQRLLEMLAATRSKMKSVAAAKQAQTNRRYHQGSSIIAPTSTERAQQQQGISRQQQQQQQQGPPERLSLPAVSTRVVPILSSTGEPVFEVGLNGSSAQEHILPVFLLNRGTKLLCGQIPQQTCPVAPYKFCIVPQNGKDANPVLNYPHAPLPQ